ncbi:MAG: hypothetical protein AB7O98_06485 [Hyphomonadaceae bacterium]
MRRLLLATAAVISLAAAPALAQVPDAVPTPPPVSAPAPDPDVTTEEQLGTSVQTPVIEGAVEAEAETTVAPPATPPVRAAAAAPAQAAVATPASANAVCQPRTTSVHFGRSSALSQQNRNAIEHAVDAASVCDLQQITIADSRSGASRAEAVRATLVRQGVPRDRITIAEASADAEAVSTGRLDVRMTFAGVADGGSPATAAAAPTTPPAATPAPEAVEPSEPDAEAEDPAGT